MHAANATPPSLRELQLWLRWIITDPRGVESALTVEPPPAGERYRAPTVSLLSWIGGPGSPRGVQERLDIYAEGYFARLVDALMANFARTAQVLGDELFRKLVAEYLKVFPSRTHDIDQAGRHLLTFVTQYEPWIGEAALHDLIRAELLAQESFLASVELPGDVRAEELAAADPARLHLRLNRGLRLLASVWNLDEVWQGAAPAQQSEVETYLLLGWTLRRLSAFERAALAQIRDGEPLARVLDTPVSPNEVQATFARWWQSGVVVDWRSKN